MVQFLKALTRRQKQLLLLLVDILTVPLAFLVAQMLQTSSLGSTRLLGDMSVIVLMLMGVAAALSVLIGIPRIRLHAYENRAVGRMALLAAGLAVASGALVWLRDGSVAVGVHVIFGLVYFLLAMAGRTTLRRLVQMLLRRNGPRCRVLIYGAGTTGVQLASALSAHETIDPIAFVDDNAALHGLTVVGLPVLAPLRIRDIVAEKNIHRVLLAMPSLSPPKQAQIARHLQEEAGVEVQALPSFAQLVGEEALIDKLTPMVPHNLLGRAQLGDQLTGGSEVYAGRSVLVSGAGGTIGSELCRQLLACGPEKLVLYELSELALYNVDMELRGLAEASGVEIVPVLGSVTDPRQVRQVLNEHAVQVVLHAAAYKHVPLVERNPLPGLANNVFGTQNLAKLAAECGVERFILISSDKAVRPANVMGASKRLAELVVQDIATRSQGMILTMVRFGNVLGSSGSVVPMFQDQIARGGPVTLTHPGVTRYFMTVHEAVGLVLLAGSFAEGGEVFVLDMGQPVQIYELARQMIESSGYSVRDRANPDGDIEIHITGLRPGEKLYEELTLAGTHAPTAHEKILSARENHLSEIEVASALRELRAAVASGDEAAARATVARWVEGYTPGLATERVS